jgi:glycosyltransferase involved in cell wall biosynthesis
MIPDLSLVIPCYNEAAALPKTIPPLVDAFQKANVRFELILVDNGSRDSTGQVIDSFIESGMPVVKAVVPVNKGFGYGILTGFRAATGNYIGYLCADGQVRAEDVLMIYELARNAEGRVLAKVRRRFRRDSMIRKINSIFYNGLMLLLFPGISTLDVNGNPRIMTAEDLKRISPTSEDWFLDAEIMLKARHLKIPILERNVAGQLRQAGRSNVKVITVFEFLKNIWRWRIGKSQASWVANVSQERLTPTTDET